MPLILPANTLLPSGYNIDNSCRFNRPDAPYMHITPGGDGDLKIFTVSFWVKRGNLNGGTSGTDRQVIFSNATNDQFSFHNDKFEFLEDGSTSASTNMVFRDLSAWYHIVATFDTNQATNTNRCKIYVNGVQVDQSTGFSTMSYVGEDLEMGFGKGSEMMSVGRSEYDDNRHFDGYLAEFHYINGTMLDHTSFGEFDEDSPTIWKPKKFTGSYGTNGFYLDFEDSANLGNDANGGTDLTESGLAAADQMLDTPTNNFCTLNPIAQIGGSDSTTKVYTEGMLSANNYKSVDATVIGTFGITSGKWYFEAMITTSGNSGATYGWVNNQFNMDAAIAYNNPSSPTGADTAAIYPSNDPMVVTAGVHDGDASNWEDTDVDDPGQYGLIGIAADFDNGKMYYSLAGSFTDVRASQNPATATNPCLAASGGLKAWTHSNTYGPWFPAIGNWSAATRTVVVNFGADSTFIGQRSAGGNADGNGYGDFAYAVPSGFYALCTKNLAEYG